jgi:ribosomal-protein-alanine N-acetyltransferase
MMLRIRRIELADAEPLAKIYVTDRDFFAPWDPRRPEEFYTPDGQRTRIAGMLADPGSYDSVIEEDGVLVGMVSLTGITRGPAQWANLGYWVAQSANGRGIATRAVALVLDYAFGDLELHRIQASTLLNNVRSQKVLGHHGFERIGVARSYLRIDGRWQDSILFQRVNGE